MRILLFAFLGVTFVLFAAIAILIFPERLIITREANWHDQFKVRIDRDGAARLSDLVDFPWDKVYLVRSYDFLNEPDLENKSSPFSFWWRGSEQYWTVAYRRPAKSTFFIRMDDREWSLKRDIRLMTSSQSAKFVRVDNSLCARGAVRCLSLEFDAPESKSTP